MTDLGLLIDTSIRGVAMGLADFGVASKPRMLWSAYHSENSGSSAALPVLAQKGLAALGAKVGDLAGIGVAIGPGSFTGIKVGMAFTYGLARGFLIGPKVIGVELLPALLAEWRRANAEHRPAGIFMPATAVQGYFVGPNSDVVRAVGVDSLQELLAEFGSSVTFGTVVPWPALQAAWTASVIKPLDSMDLFNYSMSAMLRATAKTWPKAEVGGKYRPEPHYLRVAAATANLTQSGGRYIP